MQILKQCRDYQEWLSALVDHEVSPRRERQLRAHLDQCRTCQGLYQQLAETKQAVQTRLGQQELTQAFIQRLNRALDDVDRKRREVRREERLPSPRRGTWNGATAAVAALLVVVTVGAAWLVARPDFVVGKIDLAQAHRAHQERNRPLEEPVPGIMPPQEASVVLTKSLGYSVSPATLGSTVPVHYLGAGVCRCFDKEGYALFLYRDEQRHAISLFHLQGKKGRFIGLEAATLQGRPVWRGQDGKLNIVAWQAGSTYEAWVSEVPPEEGVPSPCSPCGN